MLFKRLDDKSLCLIPQDDIDEQILDKWSDESSAEKLMGFMLEAKNLILELREKQK